MKRALTAVSILALAAGSATADIVLQGSSANVLHTNLTLVAGADFAGAGDASIKRYDEHTAPPSVLNANFRTGGQEIADDLTFAPQVGVGLLTNLGFAVANSNGVAGSVFTGGQVRIAFYDIVTGLAIPSLGGFTSFTANLPAMTLAPGAGLRVGFGAAGAQSLNAVGGGWYFGAATGVYASLQILSVTGTGGFVIADAGMQLRNGGAIGSSTDNLVGIGAGPQPTGFFNFAGAPYADSAWFIETNDVPAPSSVALLGLGGLIAARRRR